MKKQIGICILFLLSLGPLKAQQWVDSLYATQDFLDVPYGTATDFAGNVRQLTMDITVPVGDSAPECGRPLLLLIHGGAFMAGTKNDWEVALMRKEFAERGYVTASINYRLGMIQTNLSFHCNVTYIPGVEWDCLNQTDTLEWARALFRGVQDAHGAIRYLVSEFATYNIDANNVFVAGTSAGGFIALGVGFMDHPDEYPTGVGAVSTAPPPNAQWYETRCVVGYGLDTSIASMNLTRPDLGSVEGTLNLSAGPYTIRGVGNFFGANMTDVFEYNTRTVIPGLYMFHQPNDLIVPIDKSMVLAPYAYCMVTTFGCAYITNRPYVEGSRRIRNNIESRLAMSLPAPEYRYDSTLNNAPCLTQAGDPTTSGHAIDNFALRTGNMASFFSTRIVPTSPCLISSATTPRNLSPFLYPNPTDGDLKIESRGVPVSQVSLRSMSGQKLWQFAPDAMKPELNLQIPSHIPAGIHFLQIQCVDGTQFIHKVVLQR